MVVDPPRQASGTKKTLDITNFLFTPPPPRRSPTKAHYKKMALKTYKLVFSVALPFPFRWHLKYNICSKALPLTF